MNNKRQELMCKIMAVNEALYGQQYDRLQSMLTELDLRLNISFDHYYICLTGLNKRFYAHRLRMERDDFVLLYDRFYDQMSLFFNNYSILFEIAIIQYNHSKQICVLFSLPAHCRVTYSYIVEQIHKTVVSLYAENTYYQESGLNILTAVSPLLERYDQISIAYKHIEYLSSLSYFLMKDGIMTDERYQREIKPCQQEQISKSLNSILQQLGCGRIDGLEENLHQLFFFYLQNSFNFNLVDEVQGRLLRKIQQYNIAFGLDLDKAIKELKAGDVPTIRELYEELKKLLCLCAQASIDLDKKVGALTIKAICYMKTNYMRNIGVEDIAEHVHVAPYYLSKVFNKETGQNIPSYLMEIRMKHAAYLLKNSDMNVKNISLAVGIENTQYFGKLFKKHMGMTANIYREIKKEAN